MLWSCTIGRPRMETAIDVQLLTHTPDPVRVMYVAFRTCYSRFTPQQIWADIESGKISEEKMKTFIFDKLKSGHSSPRTQVYFTFAVSGLSRRAQWEIRHMWARARNALKARFPELAKPVQPKCGDQRLGYCDEPLAEYLKCPLGARRIRLHKDEIVAAAKEGRTLDSAPLTDDHIALLSPSSEREAVPVR